MKIIKIFTIGFTKKTASVFFETLKQSQAKRIVDVRLNNMWTDENLQVVHL